ncbi:MAG: DUF4870 family protein [Burkholderiales bacterium]
MRWRRRGATGRCSTCSSATRRAEAWYALAGVLLVAGFAFAALLIWRFVATLEGSVQFTAPGSVQVELARPGDYILWLDHPGPMPAGARYSVQAPDGAPLAVRPYGGISSEGAGGKSISVARFEVVVRGPHRVAVEGSFEPRPMSVGPDRLWPILRLVGLVLAALALGVGAAVAAGLYGFLNAMPASAPPGNAALPEDQERALRRLVALVYGLQAAALLVGVTFFAAVILNYLRRREAAGTWLESHFTWQIRTFWWSLGWSILGVATAVLLVGIFILLASAVWYVYRIARGWSELNEGRAV